MTDKVREALDEIDGIVASNPDDKAARLHISAAVKRARGALTSPPKGEEGGLGCYGCGRPYSAGPDLVIPDDAWRKIAPKPQGGGVLCPNCMHDRLVAAGVDTGQAPGRFTSGPMCGPANGTESQNLIADYIGKEIQVCACDVICSECVHHARAILSRIPRPVVMPHRECWLNDLIKAAEAFRMAMVKSGALTKVSQDQYIEQLRAIESALNPFNYVEEGGGSSGQSQPTTGETRAPVAQPRQATLNSPAGAALSLPPEGGEIGDVQTVADKIDDFARHGSLDHAVAFEIKLALSRLSRPVVGWQPIETAPKNGTPFWMGTASGGVMMESWHWCSEKKDFAGVMTETTLRDLKRQAPKETFLFAKMTAPTTPSPLGATSKANPS